MTYFLKRWRTSEKYTLVRHASTDAEASEADIHKVGEDYNKAVQARDAANEKIKSGNRIPLGEWRSGMSAQSIDTDGE